MSTGAMIPAIPTWLCPPPSQAAHGYVLSWGDNLPLEIVLVPMLHK